jgi:O-antigen ligase
VTAARLATALRLLAGAAIASRAAVALAAPELFPFATAAAAAVFCLTIWRPAVGLPVALALAPAGALLAPNPARSGEFLAWSFLAAWLLDLRRPLARDGWPRTIVLPAVLYATCVAASWLALTIGNAGGVPPWFLPTFLLRAVPDNYLVFSSSDTATWAFVQLLAGVGVFLATVALARIERRLATWMAWAVAGSAAVLAAATVADVVRQWAANGYETWFLARYLAGERFSLHLRDVNAAGSLYVLAGGIAAALALFGQRRRWLAATALVVMAPAFWLTGSRSALLGVACAAVALLLAGRTGRQPVTRRQGIAAAACVAILVLVTGGLVSAGGGDERGSAGSAMRLRSQFSETSARMFASSPIFGVGVGRYFERSPEFMPDGIRALYGAENAHNYFAQVFAELGVVGGAMFLWMVVAGVIAGWRQAAAPTRDATALALFAGSIGYLVTCLTGHPFLVVEAALPFWGAFGALAAANADVPSSPGESRYRTVTVAVLLLLALSLARATVAYGTVASMPGERGLDNEGVLEDGTRFRWMGPEVVTYMPAGPGFVRLVLRAPEQRLSRPMVVETAVSGRVVDRRELASDRWETIEIPVRERAFGSFRRVDVRVAPPWIDKRKLARRTSEVEVALTAMVRELRWVGVGSR